MTYNIRSSRIGTMLAATFGTNPAAATFPGLNGKIVYEDLTLSTSDYEIFVVDHDGSNPTNLTNNTAVYGATPSWSPDGSKIAIQSVRDGTDNEVVVMDADGSYQINVTANDDDDYEPAFSPDGRRIAFSSNRDGGQELYDMNATNGSGVARLTDGPTLGQDPDWQPNTALAITGMRPRSKTRDVTPRITATIVDAQDDLTQADEAFRGWTCSLVRLLSGDRYAGPRKQAALPEQARSNDRSHRLLRCRRDAELVVQGGQTPPLTASGGVSPVGDPAPSSCSARPAMPPPLCCEANAVLDHPHSRPPHTR